MPKKGKDPKEAIKRTATETLKGGAYSYGIASGGSLLGGMMQNSANKVIQSFGKSSLPVMIVGAAVTNVTIFIRYFSGKIDEAELCKQLGRTNTSLLSGGAIGNCWSSAHPYSCSWSAHWGLCGCSVERSFF